MTLVSHLNMPYGVPEFDIAQDDLLLDGLCTHRSGTAVKRLSDMQLGIVIMTYGGIIR